MPSREEQRWKHYKAEKTLRKARKQIKRNRKPDPVRRKDWVPDFFDDVDNLDWSPSERVVPRGEQERRRAVLSKARVELESIAEENPKGSDGSPVAQTTGRKGVVIQVGNGLCRVDLDGQTLMCSLRGSLSAEDTGFTNVVAVGDEVVVSESQLNQGTVEAVLPRRSVLVRPDVFYSHLHQVVVANADQLLIVASWREPAIWLELVDRYLIAAERHNLLPVVCVSKVDLAEDRASCQAALRPYGNLGYQVVFTSALTGEGVDRLRGILRGHTTVLAGLSGVGKSSLLSAIQPGLHLRTAEVSERSHEGRHTTAQVTLLNLRMGASVVDTPGIREFGLAGLRQSELAAFYPEFARTASACRFVDCSHLREPGCAVQEAVQRGEVPASRYHSYMKIRADLAG